MTSTMTRADWLALQTLLRRAIVHEKLKGEPEGGYSHVEARMLLDDALDVATSRLNDAGGGTMTECLNCASDQLLHVIGKTNDCLSLVLAGKEISEGYAPDHFPLGRGDYIDFFICTACGAPYTAKGEDIDFRDFLSALPEDN